ncbi:MAG TPA: hypothetical protein VFO79_15715 [Xanthomonadales bacterium]|nr:hypothetical protein [Xanthomonadales bacterium]
MADEYTPEMLAMLQRQVEYFSSDEFLLERAAPYRAMSPAQCWAETVELCASLDWFLDRMEPEARARALAPEPMSDEIIGILETLQRSA